MNGRKILLVPLAAVLIGTAACGSGSTTKTTTAQGGLGGAPSGAPGGGGPGQSTQKYTATGAYTLASGTVVKSGASYAGTAAGQSAVLVRGSGVLTLVKPGITKSGDTQSSDESSFYGLNAGVLASAGGKVTIKGGSVR